MIKCSKNVYNNCIFLFLSNFLVRPRNCNNLAKKIQMSPKKSLAATNVPLWKIGVQSWVQMYPLLTHFLTSSETMVLCIMFLRVPGEKALFANVLTKASILLFSFSSCGGVAFSVSGEEKILWHGLKLKQNHSINLKENASNWGPLQMHNYYFFTFITVYWQPVRHICIAETIYTNSYCVLVFTRPLFTPNKQLF